MGSLGDAIRAELKAAGTSYLVSVANLEGSGLYNACKSDPQFTVLDACREGEAVAICSGLYLGGKDCLLSIENFGLFECLDTLRALPIDMAVPLVMLIGYTARAGLSEEGAKRIEDRLGNIASQAILAGKWTEPCLEFASIPYWILESDADIHLFRAARRQAVKTGQPVALLVEAT